MTHLTIQWYTILLLYKVTQPGGRGKLQNQQAVYWIKTIADSGYK